jgi:hypothetical protein
LELTPEQRTLIERKITELIQGEPPDPFRTHAAKANALPVLRAWTACMALRPDGVIVWMDDDVQEPQIVEDARARNVGLLHASRIDPELAFLAPARPADAIACPDCKGTGRLAFPAGFEHLSRTVDCSCGGLGWVPGSHATPPGLVRRIRSVGRFARRRPFVIVAIMFLAIPVALFALSLLGFFPWSEINCSQNDIDITSGRIRYTRYLLFLPVRRSVSESALSEALSREERAGEESDWHPVVTFSPGVRHSPHYRFHGALYQIRLLEMCWESGKMTKEARRLTARRVLQLWMETGGDSRAREYIEAVGQRAMSAMGTGTTVDLDELPAP